MLVENASSGINAVMRSFPWAAGDKILYLNCAYGMVQSVLAYLVKIHAVELVCVEMEPTGFKSEEAVLAAVSETLAEHGGASAFRAAILSHITSVPAVILPVKAFCELMGSVPVVVDGAHALGQIDVDVADLGCAAYTVRPFAAPPSRSSASAQNRLSFPSASDGSAPLARFSAPPVVGLWCSGEPAQVAVRPQRHGHAVGGSAVPKGRHHRPARALLRVRRRELRWRL